MADADARRAGAEGGADLRKAEAALRESEARLRLLIGSWAQAVWETDPQGVAVADSPSWRAYTGQTLEEWLGHGWLDAIHPDDRAHAERQWREAIATRSLVDAEFRLRTPDDGWRWTNVRAAPVLDADGRVEKWAGMNIDIDTRKRAEEALQRSEASLQLAVEAADLGVWELDLVSDRSAMRSPRHDQMFGYAKPQAEWGQAIAEQHVLPEDVPTWRAAFARALETGLLEFEVGVRSPSGEVHWIAARGRTYYDATERPVRMSGVVADVTERRRAEAVLRESEERQAFLLKLSDVVRPLADPADIQGETTRLLREQLNAGWCYYVDWDLDRKVGLVLRDSASEGLPSLAGAHDVSDAPEFLQLLTVGAVLTVSDFASFDLLSTRIRQKFTALGFRSMMLAPLIKQGRLIASMLVGDTKIRDWTASEESLLGEAAERTWAAVERARAETALRESEDRYRTLFETMGQGYADCEMIRDPAGRAVDYRLIEINPAFERLTGISAAHARGRTIREVVPGIEDFWIETYDRVLREGRPDRIEHEAASLDRWYEVHAYPRDADRFAVVYEDVTDRKRAEAEACERQERQAFLLKLTDILQRLTVPSDMKAAAMHMLGTQLGVSRAQYHEVDGGEYFVTDGIGFADGLPLLDGKYRTDQFGSFVAECLEAGCAFHSDDFVTDPRPTAEERGAFAQYGVRAAVAMPLLRGGKFVAVLAIHDVRPHAWTDLEIELIRETAERVWVAVEKVRTEAAIREDEERQAFLLMLSDRLRTEENPRAIALTSVNLLAEHMRLDRAYVAQVDKAGDRAEIGPEYRRTDLAAAEGVMTLSDFPEAWSRVEAATLVLSDAAADPSLADADKQGFAALRMGALMVASARQGTDNPVWALLVASEAPRRWTVAEVALVEDVAERTWAAVERARAEAALRESEDRQAFLLALSDALGPLTDPSDIAEITTHRLCERLDVDRVCYGEIEGDLLKIERDCTRGVPSIVGEYSLEPFGPEFKDAYHADAVVRVDDIERDPRVPEAGRAELRGRQIAAFVDVVVLENERAVDLFAVQSAAPRRWTSSETALIREVADRARSAIKRARAEAALRESEERFRSFAEASEDVLWIVDAATRRLEYISPAYERIWGEPREAVMGDLGEWAARLHPDDVPPPGEGIDALFAGRNYTAEYRVRRRDGGVRYVRDTGFPIFDASGRVRRVAGVAQDLTDRRVAERALVESERRARTLMEGVPQLVWRSCDEGLWTWSSPQWRDFTGQTQEQSHGRGWLDAVHPDDREATMRAWDEARPHGMLDAEYRLRRASDGAYVWHRTRSLPVLDEDGRIVEWLGTSTDIDETRRIQDALGESEERFRRFGEASQDILWMRDAETLKWTYLTPAFETIYGISREEALAGDDYRNWLDLILPEDRERAAREIEKVRGGEHVAFEYRIRRPSDGAVRWMRNTDFPIPDGAGGIALIGGIGHDVTDLRESERRSRLLLEELQHRVRNIMAMLRSVARRTGETTDTVEDYVQHLDGRLSAMARTQALLTRDVHATVDLKNLILDELTMQAARPDRYAVTGPDVALSPKAAEVLGLAIHELATNAVKYGALCQPDGRVDVRWALLQGDGTPQLSLIWSEFGVRMDGEPSRQGFGTELITRRVPYELRGTGTMEFRPTGLVAAMEFPLEDVPSILQTDDGKVGR